MDKINCVEHGQVSALLDAVLNILNKEAGYIIKDVLTGQQYEALKLSIQVIEQVSNELHKKIEKGIK